MGLQKKYYFSFKSLTGRTHLIEIWQDTVTTITAQEIKGAANPYNVQMPKLKDIFQSVRGTGAILNLLSETDMMFWNSLYHVDPKEFVVKHYIDGTINWLGFLNSELFRESYSFVANYPVSISANDGFALMDRYSFTDVNGSHYTGMKTFYDIILIALKKIGLPWGSLNISLSTTFSGFTEAVDKTILHELYVDCANFYDEDNNPMTLRQVIENILRPYAAFVRAQKGDVYIADIHTLAQGGSITYKSYNISTGLYVSDVIDNNIKTIANIGYAGTGQNVELSGGYNKQVVSYSPYPANMIQDIVIAKESEFSTIPATWTNKDGYYYKTLGGNATFQEVSPAEFEESYFDSDPVVYLKWIPTATNQKIIGFKILPQVSLTEHDQVGLSAVKNSLAIKIEYEVLIKTKLNPYDTNLTSVDYEKLAFSGKVKIGNKYYGGPLGWVTNDPGSGSFYVSNMPSSISDSWVKGSKLVYIQNNDGIDKILKGGFDFELWSDIYSFKKYLSAQTEKNPAAILEVWLRNVKITIVNGDGTTVASTDVEYTGLLNKDFKDEGQKVSLKIGSDIHYSDRAKIMWTDTTNFFPVKKFTRNAQTFKIEELLLVSLASNYRGGSRKLTNMTLNNSFYAQNILTDTYLPGSLFMPFSFNIDYWNESVKCDLIEIFPDNLNIVI